MTVDYQRKYFPLRWTKPYIPKRSIHRDTQWPCPDWWHIGTQTEWEALKTALETLWVWNKADFMYYLKVPSTYYLDRKWANIVSKYWPVRFWTSTMTAANKAICMYVNEKSVLAVAEDKPANGFSIRPFYDDTITPISGSVPLIGSLASWWILWHSGVWVLFISADWTNWITISDKNLWATNVWDNWLYYQFWNNYWFTDTVIETLNGPVDISWMWNFWPGNYFSREYFVKNSSGNNWFTVPNNNNIWWWVTNWTWTDN